MVLVRAVAADPHLDSEPVELSEPVEPCAACAPCVCEPDRLARVARQLRYQGQWASSMGDEELVGGALAVTTLLLTAGARAARRLFRRETALARLTGHRQ